MGNELTLYTGYGKKSVYKIPGNGKTAPWLVYLHRGLSGAEAPENTIASLQVALENGFNCSEVDVRTTKDKKLVLNHNPEITGVGADGSQKTLTIADSALAELQELTLKDSPRFGKVKISAFEDVLTFARYNGFRLRLDIKPFPVRETILLAAKAVAASGMQGKITYRGVGADATLVGDVVAVDYGARFTPEGVSDYTDMIQKVGGDGRRLEIAINVNDDPNLAAACASVRELGLSTYLHPIKPSNVIKALDTMPDALEFANGTEVQTLEIIKKYVEDKVLWA